MSVDPAVLIVVDRMTRRAILAPSTGLVIDGRVVPAASGATFEDRTGRDRSLHALDGHTSLTTTWSDRSGL